MHYHSRKLAILCLSAGIDWAGVAYAEPCSRPDLPPERRIASCTALIQSDELDNENLAHAYNNRGTAYQSGGELDKAISDFSEAIRLEPKDALAFNNRGIAYDKKGDFALAIADFSTALKLKPGDDRVLKSRGWAHFWHGDYDSAINDWGAAISIEWKHAFG